MSSQFPCKQCGALLAYEVGTDHLTCDYCGFENPIDVANEAVEERDYHQALAKLSKQSLSKEQLSCSCPRCAAEFTLEANEHAGECPFCGSNIVTDTASSRRIQPWGVLPFTVPRQEARKQYQDWLKGLWFAPNKLKTYARVEDKLVGMYLPYWTYDSRTRTLYQGMRGTLYHEPIQYTAVVNGRRVVQTRMVSKIHWRQVDGEVRRIFDDVPIPASHSLPDKVRYRLTDWDFNQLKRYQEAYLSGFRSEMYQTDLDEGFRQARGFMDQIIQSDIRRDIGGDRQRILNHHTKHRNITFKHILVPTWLATFRYNHKSYRFVVNARTGSVHGERPYSPWKILLTVLLAISIALILFVLTEEHVDWERIMVEILGGY
ncbi:MAG: primosomal protein N' (replication factor Y) - superfamily II helicase [Gammaproteobacteria bacterium]|nr:primosomal protein N' (replication factor Y) - superfamily II helicase [Gammaproteobacteria bacterium]